jgi:hypothetical protein
MLALSRRASTEERRGMGVMGLRELKEVAHQQFVRGKFAQCAQTYHQILRLAPRDPNMRVRHAEACRRAGDRLQAIASYRAAANLLLELGCESRARGALKAALELDPMDPLLQADIARLSPQGTEAFLASAPEPEELPLLPPLEPRVAPPPPPAPSTLRATRPEVLLRTTALPPIHRALPSVPSVPPLVPPVLLPAPRVPSMGAKPASNARAIEPALRNAVMPPPPPREALFDAIREVPRGTPPAPDPVAPAPSQAPKPQLEVRRLSASALAFRCSPHDSWAVIRAHTPLEMHVVEHLDQLPPMLRDFTADGAAQPLTEANSNTVH